MKKEIFFKNTYVDFTEIKELPERTPDHVSDWGSKYWYTDTGVIREAGHWGIVGTCLWTINSEDRNSGRYTFVGFARWADFRQIKDAYEPRHFGENHDIDLNEDAIIMEEGREYEFVCFRYIKAIYKDARSPDHSWWHYRILAGKIK